MTIQLPSQVVSVLPPSILPERIDAYVKLSRGLNDFLGETHLFVYVKKLYLFTSSSSFEPPTQVEVSEAVTPRIIQDGFQQALLLTAKDGKEYKLPILLQEQETQHLLSILSGETKPTITPLEPRLPLPTTPVQTQDRAQEQEDDDDVDEVDDDDEGDNDVDDDSKEDTKRDEAIARLAVKDFRGAIPYAKEAMEAADDDDKKEYAGTIYCIELLAAGDPVGAFFENYDYGYVYKLSSAVTTCIAEALEAKGDILLAIETYDLEDEEKYRSKIAQLRSVLGLSEDEEDKKLTARFIEWYQNKLAKDPQDAGSWANLATHQNDAKQFDEALKSAQRSIELDPNETEAYISASEAMRGKQEYMAAIRFLEKAEEINATDPDIYSKMAEIYKEDLSDIESAIANYKKALAHKSYYPTEEEDGICKLLEESGRLDELKSFLQERINADSDNKERLLEKLRALSPNQEPSIISLPPQHSPIPLRAMQPINTDTLPQKSSPSIGRLLIAMFIFYIFIRFLL